MPAAAVIPAPIAYTKVVAVKKLVVGFLVAEPVLPSRVAYVVSASIFGESVLGIQLSSTGSSSFTVSKIECSKQA